MSFHIVAFDADPAPPMGPPSVRRWWDRRCRSWVVQAVDAAGNQIGSVIHVYTRREANAITLADFQIADE